MSSSHREELDRAQREPLLSEPRDPTRKPKEEAIRHKLRTYEALIALRNGYMPSTEQICGWIRYALKNSAVLDTRNRKLSPAGRTLIRDLRAWLEALVDFLEAKNGDDKIQEFVYHISKSQVSARIQGVSVGAAAPDAQQLYQHIRLLANLLWSSPEFRKLLNDIATVAREILADAASTVASFASETAEKIRPSQEELAEIERSADAHPSKETSREVLPSGRIIREAPQKARIYGEQLKKKGYQTQDELQEYLKQKFPKQRRDAIINRLKKIVADIQQNPDFQETVEFIINLLEDYCYRLMQVTLEEGQKAKGTLEYDEHFEKALEKGKEILIALAGGKSPDLIKVALAQVIRDVQEDEELREFWSDFTHFLRRLISEPGFVTTDQADAEAHEFFERSKVQLQQKTDRYRPDIERLFDEINKFVTAIKTDRYNRRIIETGKKVFSDIMVPDKKGGYKFKKRLTRDFMDVFLPKLISEIKYIPIPRIEYQDRDYDIILENVVFESEHFLPYRTIIETFFRAEYINDYNFTSQYQGSTRIRMENINLFIRDVSFVIRKKTGVIPFSDRGYFDLYIDGPGMTVDIALDKASYDEYYEDDESADADSYFHVQYVKVKIHRFRYKYNGYHRWAAKMLSPVIRPVIRRMVARMLEDKIKEGFETADRELHALMERVRVANIATKDGGSLEAWIRAVLSRPSTRRPKQETRFTPHGLVVQKGGDRKRGGRGEFAITIGAEEELFPGEHGPGALLPKFQTAEERVEAQRIRGWRNEIFDPKA